MANVLLLKLKPIESFCFSRRGSLQLWQFLLALLNDASNQVQSLCICLDTGDQKTPDVNYDQLELILFRFSFTVRHHLDGPGNGVQAHRA